MELKNNKEELPLEFYSEKFKAADPEELSIRSVVPFFDGKFTMTVLGRPLTISHPSMSAVFSDTKTVAKVPLTILCTRLILNGCLTLASGKMLSYSDMPWGNVYEQQFKGRCISRLAFGFGSNLEAFRKACEMIGGIPVNGGDAAYDIPFINNLTVRLIIWESDEEFPPSAQILFSDNFPFAFKAEDIAVVGDILLDAMKGREI